MTRLPAAQRREQLLETAIGLFAELGYNGATTSQLAKAAGVTEPIIYRHFSSKKELFIAVIDRTGQQTIAMWEKQLSIAKTPAQRLKRLFVANPLITDRGQGVYRVIMQAMMEITDPEILAALQQHVTDIHRFVASEVEKAQDQGQVSRHFSPEITAWTLLQLGLGYGVLAPLNLAHHAIDDRGVRVRDLVAELMLGDHAKSLQDARDDDPTHTSG
jgi:AcrR family transcriptional regulator